MAYMHHELFSWKTEASLEFRKMAWAGMAYLECYNHFKPLDTVPCRVLPHGVQIVYQHMGLQPIDDFEFLLLASTYGVYEQKLLDYSWGWGYVDDEVELSSIDILVCRDVPTAVIYMHQTTNGLDPIEIIAFRNIANAAEAYRLFENDFDIWDDKLVAAFRDLSEGIIQYSAYENSYEPQEVTAFKEIVAAVEGHMAYEVPPDFPQFLQLPSEIRGMVIHQYLLEERNDGRLSKHQHYDWWDNQCSLWDYPEVLIACDNQDPDVFPDAQTTRCPKGWLPMLAFTNKQMLGEVVVHMLQNTGRIDLKYIIGNVKSMIATWFRTLLEAIPGRDGARAVKYLNFPHMHWFNLQSAVPAMSNPSIELTVACTNLRKVDMTFHFTKVSSYDANLGRYVPSPVDEILGRFCLRPVLQCQSLEYVYFDGIYNRTSRGGNPSHLDALVEIGKWMIKRFLIAQDRKIKVGVHRRSGAWEGSLPGTLVELNDEDVRDVKKQTAQ